MVYLGFPDSLVGRVHLQYRRPQFDSWVRKIHWKRDRLPTPVFLGFPCGSAGKESACNAGDLGSIPGLGRSPGEGKGYPLQYSGLENSMDCTWGRRVGHDWATFTSLHLGGVIRNMWTGGGMRLTTMKNLSVGNTWEAGLNVIFIWSTCQFSIFCQLLSVGSITVLEDLS